MSERNVREPSQALAQRLGRLEEQMRAVKLRAWPGAVRTAAATTDEPISAADWSAVLSVTTAAGRWVMIAEADFYVAAITTHYDFWMRVTVHDPATGDELSGADFDLPDRRWFHNPATGATVVVPAVSIGHFVTNKVVTVTLSTLNLAGDDYQLSQSRLLLIPV